MAEQSSDSSSTRTMPSQDASEPSPISGGAGFMRPSFSYLNAVNNPHGSSQQSPSVPVMQSESASGLTPVGPVPLGISMSSSPSFSYNGSNSIFGMLSSHPSSTSTNGKSDGIQEIGATKHAPSFMHPAPHPARPNPNPTHFLPNHFSNAPNWLPSGPTFQVAKPIPRTPVTPCPPGIASSVPSQSNSALHATNSVPPNPVIQHQTGNIYPYPSPQATPSGPWLQTQQISGFARPPFSPFTAGTSGPYQIPSRGVPPFHISTNDIQPPGVIAQASAVGSNLTLNSAQAELPTDDNRKHVGSNEPKDDASGKELDAWTAHRTETGIIYYYNAVTGQSTYERPPSFKGESDKAAMQLSSISWEKVAGTDWSVVTTNDGKKYYYNNVTRQSSWQITNDVIELRKKQDADALKAQPVVVPNVNPESEKGSDPVSLSTPAAATGGRDATSVRSSNVSGSATALDLIKKKLHDSGAPDSNSQCPALSAAEAPELNGSRPIEANINNPHNEE